MSETEEYIVVFDESGKTDSIGLEKVPDLEEYYVGAFLVMRRDQWVISEVIFHAVENVMRQVCNSHGNEIKSGVFRNRRFVRGLASFDG